MKNIYLLLLMASLCHAPVFNISAQVQTPRSIVVNANCHGFYEYLPVGYSTGKKFPLLLFIHGVGELGDGTTQLSLILRHGPPKLINNGTFPTTFTVSGQSYSFIVISPQFIKGPSVTDIQNLFDYCIKNYHVDVSRMYLTGLSMGGGAVWNYASSSSTAANNIAAILPMCGSVGPSSTGPKIIAGANLPVWAFHNLNDATVSSSKTINWVNAINAVIPAPSPLARMTIFNASGHDAWSKAYNPSYTENGINVYQWLLLYSRGTSQTSTNKLPVANAGTDKTITLPVNSISITGSGTDADGTIASYKWSKISGPTAYAINNSAVASIVLSGLTVGSYVFRLTVTDNKGAVATDDVTITEKPATEAIPGVVEAEDYSAMSGVQSQTTTDSLGGQNVGWIDTGDWMDFTVNVATAGTYKINYRIATDSSNQKFQLKKSDGTILGTYSLPNTGGWQNWKTVSANITLSAGAQTLRIYSLSQRWNINWIQFVASSSAITIPGVVQAENYSAMSGVQSETTRDSAGGKNIGWIDNGDWMDFAVNVTAAATYKFNYRVATDSSKAQQFQLRKSDGTVLGTYSVPFTGGWQTWKTASATVTLPAGVQTIRVYSKSSRWNLNWMEFKNSTSARVVTGNELATTSSESLKVIDGYKTTKPEISIYPNPVRNILTLQFSDQALGALKVRITDVSGKARKEISTNKTLQNIQLSILVSDLNAGIYFITIEAGNKKITKQFLKLE